MTITVAEREERAFREIKRLCYAGLDSATLLRRSAECLGREIPFEGYAAGTMDPFSGLPVSAVCNEAISNGEEARFFLEHIYFDDDVTEYNWMVRNRLPVMPLSEATDGKLERALRHREFNAPIKGFGYELRSVFTVEGALWGSLCLVREKGDPDFAERELRLIRRLAPHLGAGLKAATFRQQTTHEPDGDDACGVLILDDRNRLVQHTPAAERWLHELDGLGAPGSMNWREGRDCRPPSGRWCDATAGAEIRDRPGLPLLLRPASVRLGNLWTVADAASLLDRARTPPSRRDRSNHLAR